MAVVLTERLGNVLLVRLNRPERLNALDADLLDGLKQAWSDAESPDVRAVVITGEGRGFCAGADLRGASVGQEVRSLHYTYNPHVLALTSLRKPVVCAVNGATAGAGLGLACAGDLRIAARSAKFAPGFIKMGLVPDGGATYLVARLIGYSKAFDFFCSGEAISADQALALGLVNEVIDDDELMQRAISKASMLASMPGVGVELTKLLLGMAEHQTLAEMLSLEAQYQQIAVGHPDRTAARAAVVRSLTAKAEQSTVRPSG